MKLKHYDNDGRARFITFCTHKRLPLLTNNKFRQIIIDSFKLIREEYNLKLIAYVIMPEHIHLVILPSDDTLIGGVIGNIKKAFARKIHKLLSSNNSDLIHKLTVTRNGNKRFALWQRRCYDHNCRSENSLWQKIDYCHNNPVKRGLVQTPEAWQWSSYRWYKGFKDVVLEMDFITEMD